MSKHFVSQRSLMEPYPDNCERIVVGMGCFWGAERLFWKLNGVWVTAVGYAGGHTHNPTYDAVCSKQTGHAEVVLVVFDPDVISRQSIIQRFFEGHDPTQGNRQGNDHGPQYRSVIYCTQPDQIETTTAFRSQYEPLLQQAGFGPITTDIKMLEHFYFAEEYHQQYLAKNPNGYCGIGGTGVIANS